MPFSSPSFFPPPPLFAIRSGWLRMAQSGAIAAVRQPVRGLLLGRGVGLPGRGQVHRRPNHAGNLDVMHSLFFLDSMRWRYRTVIVVGILDMCISMYVGQAVFITKREPKHQTKMSNNGQQPGAFFDLMWGPAVPPGEKLGAAYIYRSIYIIYVVHPYCPVDRLSLGEGSLETCDTPCVRARFVFSQGILAIAAFLQGFLNFCAGCVVFGYLMKLGLVSEAVYRMHVNTRCA